MSLDQDEETIYADFNADVYNDLIEYQFNNIVKLMSGLGMGESIQENVLKELSANLASLMVVENWKDEAGWFDYPTNSSQSENYPQFPQFLQNKPIDVILGSPATKQPKWKFRLFFSCLVAFLHEVFFLK